MISQHEAGMRKDASHATVTSLLFLRSHTLMLQGGKANMQRHIRTLCPFAWVHAIQNAWFKILNLVSLLDAQDVGVHNSRTATHSDTSLQAMCTWHLSLPWVF